MSKRPSPPFAPARPSPSSLALEGAITAMPMQRPHEAESLAASVLKPDRGNALAAQILGHASRRAPGPQSGAMRQKSTMRVA
jgi:hypothetical protein